MMLWTVILVSYPLIAVMGLGISALEFVPVVAIGVGFLASAWRLPINKLITIGAVSAVFAALYFLAFKLLATPSYGEKLGLFVLVIGVFGGMLGVCLQDERFLARLPAAFLIVGGIALVLLLINPSAHQEGRESYGEGNPIWMARTVSLFGVAAIWYLSRKQSFWAWSFLGVAVGAVALTGSRGPLVSLAAAAGFALIILNQNRRAPILIAGGYILAIMATIQIGFEIIPPLRAFEFGSATGRDFLYQYAGDLLVLYPYGIGVGNFNYYQFSYPHNIVLEFLVEWGWVLGGTVVFLIVWGGIRLLKSPAEYDILKLVFITEVLNAQVSGDITTPRMLYALVFVGLFFKPSKSAREAAKIQPYDHNLRAAPG